MTYAAMKATIAEMIDNNDHTEALLIKANAIKELPEGPLFVTRLNMLDAKHVEQGYLTCELVAERYEIEKAMREFEPKFPGLI